MLESRVDQIEGPHEHHSHREKTHPWWKVMCLTGVDYFSTLGYQPGIAALAAGALAPVATLVLVAVTLLGALPVYRRVAAESPHGQGSISMLERLLSFWKGKLFVLVLIGFLATDFIITITLSASDAAAHITGNPLAPQGLRGQQVLVALVLVALLAAVFLKGFKEAISIAVVLVGIYLALNLIVVVTGLYHVAASPQSLASWSSALFSRGGGNPLVMFIAALVVFPRLALGLSGFETGVTVMPLVRGGSENERDLAGRVRNTRKLLLAAALIMSFFLVASSFVTVVLIPPSEFLAGGAANGRALSYLAHQYLGNAFGSLYDFSTVLILWFAGASAMAGLLNIVPRFLPRYGMAPEWTLSVRPLVLVYAAAAILIVVIFGANVDAQGGAYATGVLVVMTSAAVAVTLAARRAGQRAGTAVFATVTIVFAYTTVDNILFRPDGVKIAAAFIGAIVLTSLISRAFRSTELRAERVTLDEPARRLIAETSGGRELHIIANRRQAGDGREYRLKEAEQREDNHIPEGEPVLFLEIVVLDPSEFSEEVLGVRGVRVDGYRILRTESPAVPNAIAAVLLHLRDATGRRPHCYFGWTEGNPLTYLLRYLLLGEGDTAPMVHEILREAEKNPKRRPAIHVGG